jgi:hypothetical protein
MGIREAGVSLYRCLLRYLLMPVAVVIGQACEPVASAETLITGAENDLTIEAHAASVQDILAILGDRFGLRYHGTSSVDRSIEGTYTGSLRRVVARLLEGHDYVIKTDGGHIEVFVLGAARRNEARQESGQTVLTPRRRRSD